ncbi:MAG: phosphate ABC transporter permease subunit PstC [Aphanocapsa sp. GSE-SYN-MK-11-07L]|jgi:phosphate transport system permease protein|nr:phosphate ABC transporter permease subunit PstC [Aphanocapsa sp. GSE-SYN-MK-11-07L]
MIDQPIKSTLAKSKPSNLVRNLQEKLIEFLLFLAASSSVAITIGIIYILISESVSFFQEVSLVEFLTGTEWTPLFADAKYGIWALLAGTIVTTAVALFVAIPIGTISAVYLSEFAPEKLREIVKPCLEILAGIPSVVYGYFALLFVTPLLQRFLSDLPSFNMLSPGLVTGIMIIPFISSISEDSMRAVPASLREGSYAMGATRLQTAWSVVLPASLSGISAAYILGISRAVGITMIVAIAGGLQPNFTWNPMESAATIATFIVSVSLGDLPHGTIEYQSIFAAGITLFVITLITNIIGHFISKRYREIY